jgi:hypothetical protein
LEVGKFAARNKLEGAEEYDLGEGEGEVKVEYGGSDRVAEGSRLGLCYQSQHGVTVISQLGHRFLGMRAVSTVCLSSLWS